MKTIKFYTLIVILFFSVNVFAQQGKKQAEYSQMLVGTWKIDTMEIKDFQVPPEYLPLIIDRYNKMKENAFFQFNEDKTYHSEGIGGLSKGQWKLSNDAKFIIVTLAETGKEEKSQILQLTEKQLIMAPVQQNSSNSKVTLFKVQ